MAIPPLNTICPWLRLHKDVVELWKNAGTAYTPTLIVSYGGVSGEYYWYQHTNVWENEKLLRFTPRNIIDTSEPSPHYAARRRI